jgi:hypothetical protein
LGSRSELCQLAPARDLSPQAPFPLRIPGRTANTSTISKPEVFSIKFPIFLDPFLFEINPKQHCALGPEEL